MGTMHLERSGLAIRAALIERAPERIQQFEADLQQANANNDPGPLNAALDRWWGIAAILTAPLSAHEQAQLAQAKSGDFSGLLTRDDNGIWIRL